ncbi:MAG: hypothetical protein GX893_01845 [Firmicutes bacterium]|nr:hypothetical protein [Bacillota bacterium]
MATLIPFLNPESIENTGERLFYQAAANLPDEHTVLYSFKYLIPESQYTRKQFVKPILSLSILR